MKIAIFGGTGLLGSNLVKLYSEHEVKAFSRKHSSNIDKKKNILIQFENLKSELLEEYIKWQPDITINTIAIIDLQKCEDNYILAKQTNCNIALTLAKIANSIDSYFIHISTDHFFNDSKLLHKEDDKITILNNYAKTKYCAEQEILSINSHALIVRTNILGFRHTQQASFFEWLLDSLSKKQNIHLYTNYYTSPIAVKILGNILIQCFQKRLCDVYNIASSEVINKYQFGIMCAKKFNFSIETISKAELKSTNLKRALTLGLDTSKIEKALNLPMPTIEDTLDILHKEYKEKI